MRRRGRQVVARLALGVAVLASLLAGMFAGSVFGRGSSVAARPAQGHAAMPKLVEKKPAQVLAAYLAALAAIHRPKALSFEFTLSQLGLHDMEQTHRVYRSGLDERDETVVVDGYTLGAPAVRILRNRTYRYDIETTAPRPAQYVFAYAGATHLGGFVTYRFHTRVKSPRAFEVVGIEIDGRSFLPSLVTFRIAGGGARGAGSLSYGLADGRWVVREAKVLAALANGTKARERIVWSTYRFFDALPSATFEAPHPDPSATPNVLAPLVPPGVAPQTNAGEPPP